MSEAVDYEQLHNWAKQTVARLQFQMQRQEMVNAILPSMKNPFGMISQITKGPTEQFQQSVLRLEELDKRPPETQPIEKLLAAAKHRTALLRELLAKLEAQ